MRYLTVRAEAAGTGPLHPLGEALGEATSFAREAIHHVELLDDDTVLMLAEGSGDQSSYIEVMQASPYVKEFLVSGTERWMAVTQFELSPPTAELMRRGDRPGIVVDTPIQINADGSLRITYLGDELDLQDLFDSLTDDAPFEIEVLETGSYSPDQHALTRLLTARQREVLETALDVGYYELPREATHESIAEQLDIAPTTAGEHLRKIERRVFTAIVQ
ncbi:helix-turn-helix domain-containing protein [Halobellus limi]|jgi:predicted DNA binding protein|uniref:HTH DNA binding domain-containing protein n=1 Tax=Halobellus limi TaxID=699433 RepID=A0A1H6BUV8_9EURY|nr:helix-turn-helix domain-containing protein [Halobellus limi]QCC49466.1 helix-turn-helix domain-containing protein [Halobellus limi]SEG64227.1 HTH DNA binding domain-containing protein [Halobellus limi]